MMKQTHPRTHTYIYVCAVCIKVGFRRESGTLSVGARRKVRASEREEEELKRGVMNLLPRRPPKPPPGLKLTTV